MRQVDVPVHLSEMGRTLPRAAGGKKWAGPTRLCPTTEGSHWVFDQHEPATGARNREETGEFKRLLNGMQRGALEGGAAEPRVVMRKVLGV